MLDAAGWPSLTWTSRAGWRHQVTSFFTSDEGEALRSSNPNEIIALDRMLRIAFAMATFAESSSGRGCTASYFTIARRAGEPDAVKARTAVRRTCKLLIAAGFAILITEGRWLSDIEKAAATAHHGGQQINAARTFALVSPAEMVTRFGNGKTARRHPTRIRRRPRPTPKPQPVGPAQPSESGHEALTCGGTLSPKGIESSLSFREKESPNARSARTRKTPSRRTASTAAPRPLAQQRLAAAMVHPTTGILGLRSQFTLRPGIPEPGTHIGHVCKLLDDLGVDASRWTVEEIKQRLDEAGRKHSLTSTIVDAHDRLRYLAWWMRRIDWSAPSPSELKLAAAQEHAARREWQRAQNALDALIASPPPTPERQAELVKHWPSMTTPSATPARREHVQTSSAQLRRTLLTSWRSPKPPPATEADEPPPRDPTTTESDPPPTASTTERNHHDQRKHDNMDNPRHLA